MNRQRKSAVLIPFVKRLASHAGTKRTKATPAPQVKEHAGAGPSLADRTNLRPPKNAEGKVLVTKEEAKNSSGILPVAGVPEAKKPGFVDAATATSTPVSRFNEVVQCCADYADDITDYLFYVEQKKNLPEDFLRGQQVTSKMRSVLIDWLVQVHQRFHLIPETLYGTVDILDRCLSLGLVGKADLQLLGATCLWISSKFEETSPPEAADLIYITDDSITRKEILQMEMKVLATVGFELDRPSPLFFLRRLSKGLKPPLRDLSMYISELAVYDYSTCHFPPSVIAAGAVCIAMIIKGHALPRDFFDFARVPLETAEVFLPVLAKVVMRDRVSTKLVAIREIYSGFKHLRVARLLPSDIVNLEKISKNAKYAITWLP